MMTNSTSKNNCNGEAYTRVRIEDEMEEMRQLKKKFKELERYKRETLDNMKKKLIEHDDRIQSLEVEHRELRTNNHREHQEMMVAIHKTDTECKRSK